MNTVKVSLLVGLTLAIAAVAAVADDKKKDTPDFNPEAMKKLWAAYGKPGAAHKGFKKLVGKWKTKTTEYKHGKPAEPTEGTAEFKIILGGRFLMQQFNGTHHGKPHNGLGITGYDNAKKKYVGIWADNMGTGIMRTEGEYNVEETKLVEYGTSSSPIGPLNWKLVSDYKTDDYFTFTLSLMKDDKPTKILEVEYTRK